MQTNTIAANESSLSLLKTSSFAQSQSLGASSGSRAERSGGSTRQGPPPLADMLSNLSDSDKEQLFASLQQLASEVDSGQTSTSQAFDAFSQMVSQMVDQARGKAQKLEVPPQDPANPMEEAMSRFQDFLQSLLSRQSNNQNLGTQKSANSGYNLDSLSSSSSFTVGIFIQQQA